MGQFKGFKPEAFQFLFELELNNDKKWFESRKKEYKKLLQLPAIDFIEDLGKKLQQIATINLDLRTNGSGILMRHYRDTRFSKDKSPYKTNISGMFWDGIGKKTMQSAFGFQMTKDELGLMAGCFAFDKEKLEAYRQGVDNDGKTLTKIIKELNKTGYEISGEQYKKIPKGFEADHPYAELLKYKGLYSFAPLISGDRLLSEDLANICFKHFKAMAPLQQWLHQQTPQLV